MVKASYCLIFFVIFGLRTALSQIQQDFEFILEKNPIVASEKSATTTFNWCESSETKLAFLGLICVYQAFISSQHDRSRMCHFTPSCSKFGMTAIQKYGAFYGTLMAVDRIQRCHGYGLKFYPFDQKTHRRIDPVENYFLKDDRQ